MYNVTQAEFENLAKLGNLVAVYRELVSDALTPVAAFAAVGGDQHSFLLESVVGGQNWAAYSFVGVRPRGVVRWTDGKASVEWFDCGDAAPAHAGEWQAADPALALQQVLQQFTPAPDASLPRFWGGAVGWFGYDTVRAFEDLPTTKPDLVQLPTMCMVISDTLLIFDNLRQTLKVVAVAHMPSGSSAAVAYRSACDRVDALVAKLAAPVRLPQLVTTAAKSNEPTSRFGRQSYCNAVESIREYIKAGDAFQVVLSQRFEFAAVKIDPFTAYRALRLTNPSPYMFHLNFADAIVTGASPETLARLVDGMVSVRPIAGTRKRGRTQLEDTELAADLKRDSKECAEHLMLIDLGRNDVGSVCEPATVRVEEMMTIELYSQVMHMTSHVAGKLASGKNWVDVFKATFPAGTLSGAPKIRAMEIIDELEPHRRGLYGGAVGYVSFDGNLDMAIAIRTMVRANDTIAVQAGAGIVYDSNPDAEYEETVSKASAVFRALALAAASSAAVGGQS